LDFIEKLNRLIGLYASTLKSVFNLRLWVPFFLYALLQFAVLTLLLFYSRPHIFPILSPIVALMGGAEAELFSHYPGLYLMLPIVYQWGKLFVGIIFEGLAAGFTVVLFANYFSRRTSNRWRLSEAFKAWPQLLIGWVIITAILFVVNWYPPGMARTLLHQSPYRAAAFDIGLKIVTVALYSVFIYAIPAIIVLRQNVLRAIGTSLGYFFKNPFFSFFLALVPYILSLPVSYLTGNTEVIVTRFSPELIYYILVLGIIVDLIINYWVTGAVTLFLIEEKE
jgi:hypothetical protein